MSTDPENSPKPTRNCVICGDELKEPMTTLCCCKILCKLNISEERQMTKRDLTDCTPTDSLEPLVRPLTASKPIKPVPQAGNLEFEGRKLKDYHVETITEFIQILTELKEEKIKENGRILSLALNDIIENCQDLIAVIQWKIETVKPTDFPEGREPNKYQYTSFRLELQKHDSTSLDDFRLMSRDLKQNDNPPAGAVQPEQRGPPCTEMRREVAQVDTAPGGGTLNRTHHIQRPRNSEPYDRYTHYSRIMTSASRAMVSIDRGRLHSSNPLSPLVVPVPPWASLPDPLDPSLDERGGQVPAPQAAAGHPQHPPGAPPSENHPPAGDVAH